MSNVVVPKPNKKRLGEIISAAIIASNERFEDIAPEIGISPSHLRAVAGGSKLSKGAVLVRLAEYLSISPEPLLTAAGYLVQLDDRLETGAIRALEAEGLTIPAIQRIIDDQAFARAVKRLIQAAAEI